MSQELTLAQALQTGVQHHQSGRMLEAEAAYRQVLSREPNHPDALHLLGLLAHQAGRSEAAIELVNRAIRARPDNPVFYNNLGTIYPALNKLDEAVSCFEKALELKADYADAYHNLGNVFCEQHKLDDAVACYRKALALRPDHAGLYHHLAKILTVQGKHDDAIACLQRTLELQPDFAEAHNDLGNALNDQGKWDEAVACYRKALTLSPDHAGMRYNLGATLHDQGKLEEAVECYRHAIRLQPGYAEAHHALGCLLHEQGKLDEAVACYRNAIGLKPDYAEAHNNLGVTLQDQNKREEAVGCYRRALALKPDWAAAYGNLVIAYLAEGRYSDAQRCYNESIALKSDVRVRIRLDLVLPFIMDTKEEVLASRAQFEKNVDRLIEDKVKLDDPYGAGCLTNFYLAFHGLNDKDIQQKIARFYEGCSPALLYESPHCAKPRQADKKIRIGFASKFIYVHSVSRCFSRIVEELSRSGEFDVTLISGPDYAEKSTVNAYPNFKGAHARLPNHLERARKMIAALELDILVYLDVGMEPLYYFLAFARLARAQCVMGGHPVTTGIGNMDYFLSSAVAEAADADSHYSETLVRLPISTFYYKRPVLPIKSKTRADFGLPEEGSIYLCPMGLQKMHPDFDEAIARILQLDSNGYVVLFHSDTTSREILAKRFEKTIPEGVRQRIMFLPWIYDYPDFIRINALADVVLDPFHFGIGSTAIATFAVGTPIVTKPADFLRGRVGLFYCKLLDIMECVAADVEDYARRAVAIATDQSMRESIKSKILANSSAIYENPQPIKDLAKFFRTLKAQFSGLAATDH